VPANVTMDVWRQVAEHSHRDERRRTVFHASMLSLREGETTYDATGRALYCSTEAEAARGELFRSIPMWGRRVTMVTPKTICVVECITRKSRQRRMAPVFEHVLKSLKPGGQA